MSKELVEQYITEVQSLIDRAKKDDIVIVPILQGDESQVRPFIQVRPKTAEEKLSELEAAKPVETKKKK